MTNYRQLTAVEGFIGLVVALLAGAVAFGLVLLVLVVGGLLALLGGAMLLFRMLGEAVFGKVPGPPRQVIVRHNPPRDEGVRRGVIEGQVLNRKA